MQKIITFFIAMVLTLGAFSASGQIIRRKSDALCARDSVAYIIVGRDTIPEILGQRNFGRFDRGLDNHMFVPKGKFGFGMTAQYGELQSADIQLLSVLRDVDFKGKLYSIKPYICYFFRHNQSLGMRLNYTHGFADLDKVSINVMDDMNFSFTDLYYGQTSMSASAFYRYFIGLDKVRRFGMFNEVDLAFGGGSSDFKRMYDGELRHTHTVSTHGALTFSPGVSVFMEKFAAFNVSFGVFGIDWQADRQSTNGVDEGKRVSSGANFRFNIFNINFGLMVVI